MASCRDHEHFCQKKPWKKHKEKRCCEKLTVNCFCKTRMTMKKISVRHKIIGITTAWVSSGWWTPDSAAEPFLPVYRGAPPLSLSRSLAALASFAASAACHRSTTVREDQSQRRSVLCIHTCAPAPSFPRASASEGRRLTNHARTASEDSSFCRNPGCAPAATVYHTERRPDLPNGRTLTTKNKRGRARTA